MSEPILSSLRKHQLHKKPEVLASADQARKLTAFRVSRGEAVADPVNFEGYFTSQAQQARDLGVQYRELMRR